MYFLINKNTKKIPVFLGFQFFFFKNDLQEALPFFCNFGHILLAFYAIFAMQPWIWIYHLVLGQKQTSSATDWQQVFFRPNVQKFVLTQFFAISTQSKKHTSAFIATIYLGQFKCPRKTFCAKMIFRIWQKYQYQIFEIPSQLLRYKPKRKCQQFVVSTGIFRQILTALPILFQDLKAENSLEIRVPPDRICLLNLT